MISAFSFLHLSSESFASRCLLFHLDSRCLLEQFERSRQHTIAQRRTNTLTRYFIFVSCNLRINNLAAWRRHYFLPPRINFSRVGFEILESSSSWRRKQRAGGSPGALRLAKCCWRWRARARDNTESSVVVSRLRGWIGTFANRITRYICVRLECGCSCTELWKCLRSLPRQT